MKQFEEKYLAAVDLGSSKIGLCVAHIQEEAVHIVYYRETPSAGILSSAIYIPMQTAREVRKAVSEAEDELMVKISGVVVGLPRNDIVQVTASALRKRAEPDEYVSEEEIRAIKEEALETYPLSDPEHQAIYGAVAQSFTLEEGMRLTEREIVGTLTPSIEGEFKVFIGRRQAVQAIDKMFRGTGVEVLRKYFLPEVMAKAVLNKEEMKGGVALVDIGAGVTSVAVYRGGVLRYYAAIPFGGRTVTGDIESECSLEDELAEKVKIRFGVCPPERLGPNGDKVLQIRLSEPYREIPVRYISEVITARYREIIEAVLYHIQESGLQNALRGGIVLTGGAAAQSGLEAMLRDISGYSVRKGYPKPLFSSPAGSAVMSPSATAAVGMILAARDEGIPDCAGERRESAEVKEAAPGPEEPQEEPAGPAEETPEPEKANPSPGRSGRRGRRKDVDDPAQGTLDLVWTKVEDVFLKIYDYMNKNEGNNLS
jgi:cell division protein FtsA